MTEQEHAEKLVDFWVVPDGDDGTVLTRRFLIRLVTRAIEIGVERQKGREILK